MADLSPNPLRHLWHWGTKALQTRRAPPAFARGASLATWLDGIAGHAPPETDGTSDDAFPGADGIGNGALSRPKAIGAGVRPPGA